MDATTDGQVHDHNVPEEPISAQLIYEESLHAIVSYEGPEGTPITDSLGSNERKQKLRLENKDAPLAAHPSIALHLLTSYNLDVYDLARLEATCSFFREPAKFAPDHELPITEVAAFDVCQKKAIFRPMTEEQRHFLKRKCGGSWKLVLRFLLLGEACSRTGMSQAIAGPGHSIAITSAGAVLSFGFNSHGQLGHGTTDNELQPRLIRSLEGIRIIQAAVGSNQTMLVSDAGQVYAFGKVRNWVDENGVRGSKRLTTPLLVESLRDVFVVQATIGNYFSAVLSREGQVYTFYWENGSNLGHLGHADDPEPRPLLGALENLSVVQISAGNCYLLALACAPTGMPFFVDLPNHINWSVYSVGCGLGGKLGHGTQTSEEFPRLIEHFDTLNFQPVVVSAGAWHAVALGSDGRICTWGWGSYGCLGHGNTDNLSVPTVVEALSHAKAVHVATGYYTTFVVSEDGDVYSFGFGGPHLGQNDAQMEIRGNFPKPAIVRSLELLKERIVQISISNAHTIHTLALTESGKLYAFGSGDKGQCGIRLPPGHLPEILKPMRADIDLA